MKYILRQCFCVNYFTASLKLDKQCKLRDVFLPPPWEDIWSQIIPLLLPPDHPPFPAKGGSPKKCKPSLKHKLKK